LPAKSPQAVRRFRDSATRAGSIRNVSFRSILANGDIENSTSAGMFAA
jgi:hypothetical protein